VRPAPARRRARRALVTGATLLALPLGLAACGGGSAAPTTSATTPPTASALAEPGRPASSTDTTTTSTTTTSTSTTSTSSPTTSTSSSLPAPQVLAGTLPAGAASALGPMERVSVPLLPPAAAAATGASGATGGGASTTTLAAPRQLVAFRRFGSGPDLLLLGGQRATVTSWDPAVLISLAAHYRVTVFDWPGSGYSGPLAVPVSVEAAADLTAGLVTTLGLTQPTVLGWGVGGVVALALAERHPGSLSHLVLLETPASGPGAVPPAPAVRQALASPGETTAQMSRLYFPPSAESARLAWLSDLEAVAPDDLTASAVTASSRFAAAAWSDAAVWRGLADLEGPVLLLAGSLDEVVPPENGARLAAALHTRLLVLPGAGYASMSQQLTVVMASLGRFLSPPSG